mmetsp:Transcript_10185/g.13354  ORF Transcript_10185/g.13354 Transcript_10185/m.13354 type:complete len:121 (+) Transcript_10185:797-1159(+)
MSDLKDIPEIIGGVLLVAVAFVSAIYGLALYRNKTTEAIEANQRTASMSWPTPKRSKNYRLSSSQSEENSTNLSSKFSGIDVNLKSRMIINSRPTPEKSNVSFSNSFDDIDLLEEPSARV